MSAGHVNYVRHLNGFFRQVKKDDRLHANHVSLYIALFQIWNEHRFANPFPIIRHEVLLLCRIGSYNTYTQCLKALHEFGYILYQPAAQRGSLSCISIQHLGGEGLRFDDQEISIGIDTGATHSSEEIATGNDRNNDTAPVAELRPFNKHINNLKTGSDVSLFPIKKIRSDTGNAVPPEPEAVTDYFVALGHPPCEAEKFYCHYRANGWKQGGKIPILDWQAAAKKWIHNIKPHKSYSYDKRADPAGRTIERLHANQHKNYTEPL